ncbi:MAG TPA: sugar phosphate nucleotidyltransferase [Candidatus Sumerlaeota bacterium]|nr:sugar phosphate nucleotidyltransferase [Candidatus Sumerlaeota bacterium]
MSETIAMVLAGGQGSRLSILSEHRAKPAVPFGSNYRIIDFVLSNIMHSGIPYAGILTQYKPYSLMAHIGSGESWGFTSRQSVLKILPPYRGTTAGDWYAGTADAICQNLSFISRFDVDTVLVLSGDHIYNMNYSDLVEFHKRHKADVTIATQPVPWEETARFGVLKSDKSGRIEGFQEKPKSDPISNQANLGIYVFRRAFLEERLREDAQDPASTHDFGKDLIPKMVGESRCYAFEFSHYWRDVGTLESYWEANMECLNPRGGLDLDAWRVHTNWTDEPSHFHMPSHIYGNGTIVNALVGKGSSVRGRVINSILFRGVEVQEGAEVRDSVLMDGVRVCSGARVSRLIADKYAEIGVRSVVGEKETDAPPPNFEHPDLLASGLTLIGRYTKTPENCRIGLNCLVYPDLGPECFPAEGLSSGGSICNHPG